MILFKKVADLHKWIDVQKEKGHSVGFVPTMGALHNGHISLVEASKKENQVTVCCIFVNPTQFTDPTDFEKYPITLEKDIEMLEAAGSDILFLPPVKEMYPDGIKNKIHYNIGYLETVLEGKFRPGHFQGVCTIVHRLLDIVRPDNLYLGQKDYQQCMVIIKLIELIRQDKKINVNLCPTLREADGLAMSSRNMRLNKEERLNAIEIYCCLSMIKENLQLEDIAVLQQRAYSMLEKKGFKIDYIEIADAKNLSDVKKWDGKNKLVALVAAFMSEVRLIDNMLLN